MQNETKNKIKSLKTASMCLTLVILVCVAIISICAIQAKQLKEEKPVVLPNGNLSHSIFDLQNNEYETNLNMPTFYYINNGHYAYDMYANIPKADVNTSSFFELDDSLTLGVTTCENADGSLDVLKADIKEGFSIGDVEVIKEEEGYANGWVAKFLLFTAKSGETDINGAVYIAQTEEGSFVISAIGLKNFDYLQEYARTTYNTVRVTEEWQKNNVQETSQMFVPENNEEVSDEISEEDVTEELFQDNNAEGGN